MNIFLANVGNRDLAYNLFDTDASLYVYFEKKCEYWNDIIKELELPGKGTRLAAKKLNANFEKYKHKLTAPIIFPFLEFVLTKVDKIDSLVLLVTDNPKENRNWAWDTIETGEILEKLVREHRNLTTKIETIKIVKAEILKPNDYDAAYKFIAQKLDALFQDKADNVFTAISGGIPAMNSALQSYAIERFGIKTHLIQKDEPSDDEKESGIHGQAKLINNWIFRKTIILRLVKTLLQRYDYEGVRALLKDEFINEPTMSRLCDHGKARFNLDFKKAEGVLKGIKSNSMVESLRNSAAHPSNLQRISEITFIAQILLERGDLIGFLTRAASFRELIINNIARTLGITFSSSYLSFSKKLEDVKGTASKISEFHKKDKIRTILKQIDWGTNLAELCELRNNVIHYAQGINISDIEKILKNPKTDFSQLTSTIVDDLLELEVLFSHKIQINNPFDTFNSLNKMIIQLLENYQT